MINKKKFYLNLTKNLIKLNPLRSLLLLLAFILVYVSTIVPNTIYFLNVNKHIVDGEKHYYGVSQYRDVIVFDEEQTLYDGNLIKYEKYSEGKIASIVFYIICFLIFIISLFDIGVDLDIDEALRKTIKSDLTERIIDGEYIYTSYSKLLHRGHKITNLHYLKFKEFLKLESFYTKKEIRDNKLKKIGI